MQTLVLIAHPTVDDSPTQSFLKASGQDLSHVQFRSLDQLYPTGDIDVAAERQALAQADQVIFQFPLYWYSAPASLKQWLDQVLQTRLEEKIPNYTSKTLGLVVSLGTPEKAFVAGGAEGFTLSELLRPYQALAQKLKMTYRAPLIISQFNYMTEQAKMALLIEYQQYLTMTATSFDARTTWLLDRLQKLQQAQPNQPELAAILATLTANQEQLQDLKDTIAMMKAGKIMDRIDQMIVQLQAQEKDYAQRAFYEALRQLLKAQAQRLALAEAEVDGRTWNHEQW